MLKVLLKSIREYKKPSILAPIYVSVEVILECFIPLIMTYILNNAQSDAPNTNLIIMLSLVIVALGFLSLLFGVLSGRAAALAASGFAKNVRQDVFYKIQEFSFENIDNFSSASLVTRLTTDIMWIQQAYGMIVRIVVRAPLVLIFSIIMAMTLNVKLALIYCLMIPFLGFALFLIVKIAMKKFDRVFTKYDNLNASVEENIKGIRVVKTYVREEYEKEKFAKAADEVKNDFIKAERVVAWNGPCMIFALNVCLVLVVYFACYLVVSTNQVEFNLAEISAMMTYGAQILMGLMFLSNIFVMLSISMTSIKRVAEVLNAEPTIKNPENPVYEVNDGSIEFKNVSFKYKLEAEKYALADVNIKIESGMTVGILGGTGSSKTTFVNLLSRLYDTTIGDILVGGVNVKEYDLKTLRDQVAVVLQKNVLFSGTIKENLRWGDKNATDEELIRACKLACADEFIQTFPDKYDTKIDQGGANVSGGQKQRLCIARALLKKPKILILDDSTSAVDTKTDAMIRKAMAEEIPNTTKIIIAQRVASIENADMIIVLDGGKIVNVGNHDELMISSEIYKEIYELQTRNGGKSDE